MKFWIVFALSAALFWGAYVPTIGLGQAAFGGRSNPNSSMRAFLFIGLAYFFMAIVIPGIWLFTHQLPAGTGQGQDGGFNMTGAWISTLAGVLGAAGALGVVFALKYGGGNAMYVAPVVFAGAPIINVLISWILNAMKGQAEAPNLLFIVGLIVSVVGVSMVLLNSPTPHAPAKPATTTAAPETTVPQH